MSLGLEWDSHRTAELGVPRYRAGARASILGPLCAKKFERDDENCSHRKTGQIMCYINRTR